MIDKPMCSTTKKDILDNISGKFALLFSYETKIDEDVINAAGKCHHNNIIIHAFLIRVVNNTIFNMNMVLIFLKYCNIEYMLIIFKHFVYHYV